MGNFENLRELDQKNRLFMRMMRERKQDSALSLHSPIVQCVSNLLSEADDPTVLSGRHMVEGEALRDRREKSANGTGVAMILIWKVFLECLFLEFEKAERTSQATEWKYVFVMTQTFYWYYSGIALLSLARLDGRKKKQRNRLHQGKEQLARLRKVANFCPFLMHRVFLLEALLALCHCKTNLAFTKFEASMNWARQHKSVGDEAVACEHTGIVLLEQGREEDGRRLINKAVYLYKQWGSHAKVQQLSCTYNLSVEAEQE